MEPILNAKPFDILVTHVEKEHGLVKIFGQVDLKTSQVSGVASTGRDFFLIPLKYFP